MQTHLHSRRYDLDWLRIIAFGLLIFYHIGMFYVEWDWHIKSVHASEVAEPLMRLLNPWRLALLFFISGLALRFAMEKAQIKSFTWQRFWRLFIPLVFGVHIIVAPQSWLQLLESGEINSGFWHFYPEYLIGTSEYSVAIPTWNHLWYVVYLLIYTLFLAPIARSLSNFMTGRGAAITKRLFSRPWTILIIPALPYLVYRICLDPHFPTTHDVVNDWANHAHSFTMLLTGFLLAKDETFWFAVSKIFKPALVITVTLGLTLTLVWNNWDAITEGQTWLWPARFGRILYAWIMITALLGAAQAWLNRPSRVLTYMTEAIFPWYILHQTLIIMAGYWLTRRGLSAGVEFLGVTIATFGGCLLLHEVIIRKSRILRPFFGLKSKSQRSGADGSGVSAASSSVAVSID